jgi:hypothetical protein
MIFNLQQIKNWKMLDNNFSYVHKVKLLSLNNNKGF